MTVEPTDKKDKNDDDDESGGQTGEIHFRYRDILSLEPRDDALAPHEIKHLLLMHEEIHKSRVKKQQLTRAERAAVKEGRLVPVTAANYAKGLTGGGAGTIANYKTHPITAKAQFSGIDKQVIAVPSHNQADTNTENRDKELRYQLQNAPKFNPKPRPY